MARTRSPQKTCHNIAVALDRDIKGAFHKRIKRLGFATVGRTFEPITQSAFVEALLPYLSNEPKRDRDLLLRGETLKRASGDEIYTLIFRNLFVNEDDLKIAEIVSNYFDAVRTRWPTAWAERGRGMILNRTNGFRALMRFLRHAYLEICAPGDVPKAEKFVNRVFSQIRLEDDSFSVENFPPGTSGESRLYRVLRNEDAL